jgi:methylmalonyl-CoA/ethylmalonyl-CoA epimerase
MSTPLDLPSHMFTAIDHVGMAVPDLDEAIAFYRDTFGMTLAHEETNEEQGVREAMMAVGDSGSCVQLLAPLSESSTIAKFIDRNGPGCQQIAYRVTDVEQVARHLRQPDQLRAPQGRRRHPGRDRRAEPRRHSLTVPCITGGGREITLHGTVTHQ